MWIMANATARFNLNIEESMLRHQRNCIKVYYLNNKYLCFSCMYLIILIFKIKNKKFGHVNCGGGH